MLGIFQIHEPDSIEEASSLLKEYGYEAAVYAGGTELLLVMKEKLAHYSHLVNIKTIPGLDEISFDPEARTLRIGALTTHRQLEHSSLIAEHAPLLAEMESTVGNVRVRAMGTIGGNLCFAEPHSDPATLLLAWDAVLEVGSDEARRRIPIADFLLGMFETALQPGEILIDVHLQLLPANAAGAYRKFSTHERPTATVAALLQLEQGVIADARLAVGSVGPAAFRAKEAEEMLRGQQPQEELIASAAESASRAADPVDDLHGSAEYKRHLVRVLAAEALDLAARRAQAEVDYD